MKRYQIIGWIWILLSCTWWSCQSEETIDWLVLYEDVKRNNVLLERNSEGLSRAFKAAHFPYDTYASMKTSDSIIEVKTSQSLKLIDTINLKISQVEKNQKAVQKILFQDKYLNTLQDYNHQLYSAIYPMIAEYDTASISLPIDKINRYESFKNASVDQSIYLLEQLKNDILFSKNIILNYLFYNKDPFDGNTYKDWIKPFSDAPKTSIPKGQNFETQIYCGEMERRDKLITMSVNNQKISVNKNIGYYKVKTNSIGIQEYKVSIRIKNPVTGKSDIYRRTFEYEVIEPK